MEYWALCSNPLFTQGAYSHLRAFRAASHAGSRGSVSPTGAAEGEVVPREHEHMMMIYVIQQRLSTWLRKYELK